MGFRGSQALPPPLTPILEGGGAAARTRDENFLRGAGAGWEFLSSVSHAGKGAKRAPK